MAKGPRGEIYEADDGIRWHLKSGNNKIIAESGEAYEEERKAVAAFDTAFNGQHSLKLLDGTMQEVEVEVIAEGREAERVGAGGGLVGLPEDPNHPLYSPLTVDGNKV